jgi:PmbA protein
VTSTDLDLVAERLLNLARSAGADSADVVVLRDADLSIEVRNGTLEHAERAESTEIGLRAIVGRRQASVAASDLSEATLEEMARRGVVMARAAPEDPTVGLAPPEALSEQRDSVALEICDPAPEPSPEDLSQMALAAEAAARDVSGVTQIEQATGAHQRRLGVLAASNGFLGHYRQSVTGLSCIAICGEGLGMERDWYGEQRVHRSDLPAAEEVGRIAGERTVARKGARKPPTGAYPVIYDERVAGTLIGHLVAAVNGSAIARGSSWLRDALGRQILPAGLSLTEDPHRRRARLSQAFDAEGLPTQPRVIVEAGLLTGWTLDLGTARKLGMASTANAARGPSGPPSPSITNLELTSGDATRDDLLREMGTGLLATSMLGSSINATTGDYSRGAGGFWVEGGEIAFPVNECTIAGNLRDMLRTIRPANDARPWQSRRVPSLLVDGLVIAGA